MPDPGHFSSVGWIFVAIVSLVIGINQIDDFLKRRRGQPANEELKGGADVLTARVLTLEKEAGEALTRRRAMHDKIDKMESRLREELKSDTELLHEKINKVDREVAALSAKTDGLARVCDLQTQQLARIETSVQRLSERIRA